MTATCSTRPAEFILHLERGKVKLYTGGYDTFMATRAAAARQLDMAFAKKQDAARAHMQKFVDRFKASRRPRRRQAQSRMKMLAKMATCWKCRPTSIRRAHPHCPRPPKPASPPLITMDRASVGYEAGQADPDQPVLPLRSVRPYRAVGQERQRQIDHGQAAGRQACRPWAATSRRRASW